MSLLTQRHRMCFLFWCDRRDLNPYPCGHAPQTCAYANSATIAKSNGDIIFIFGWNVKIFLRLEACDDYLLLCRPRHFVQRNGCSSGIMPCNQTPYKTVVPPTGNPSDPTLRRLCNALHTPSEDLCRLQSLHPTITYSPARKP